MSIINTSLGFIFVHVPKAAGTTVTAELSRYTRWCDLEIGGTQFGEELQPVYTKRFNLRKHSTIVEIRNLIGADEARKFFKFAFVRDPLSRALSTYHFLRKWEGAGNFRQEALKFASFEDFVMSDMWASSGGPDNILQPQANWVTDPKEPRVLLVDYIGKTEMLAADLATIVAKFDPSNAEKISETDVIKVRNSSGKYEKPLEMPPDVKERIYNRYRLDYELFKY